MRQSTPDEYYKATSYDTERSIVPEYDAHTPIPIVDQGSGRYLGQVPQYSGTEWYPIRRAGEVLPGMSIELPSGDLPLPSVDVMRGSRMDITPIAPYYVPQVRRIPLVVASDRDSMSAEDNTLPVEDDRPTEQDSSPITYGEDDIATSDILPPPEANGSIPIELSDEDGDDILVDSNDPDGGMDQTSPPTIESTGPEPTEKTPVEVNVHVHRSIRHSIDKIAIIMGFCYVGCEDKWVLPTGIMVDLYHAYRHARDIGCDTIVVITDYEASSISPGEGSRMAPITPHARWSEGRGDTSIDTSSLEYGDESQSTTLPGEGRSKHVEGHTRARRRARLVATGAVEHDLDDFITSLGRSGSTKKGSVGELIRYVGRPMFKRDMGRILSRNRRGSDHIELTNPSITPPRPHDREIMLYYSGHADQGDILLPHYVLPNVSTWKPHRTIDRVPLHTLLADMLNTYDDASFTSTTTREGHMNPTPSSHHTIGHTASPRSTTQLFAILDCCGPHPTRLRYQYDKASKVALLVSPTGELRMRPHLPLSPTSEGRDNTTYLSVPSGSRVICIVSPGGNGEGGDRLTLTDSSPWSIDADRYRPTYLSEQSRGYRTDGGGTREVAMRDTYHLPIIPSTHSRDLRAYTTGEGSLFSRRVWDILRPWRLGSEEVGSRISVGVDTRLGTGIDTRSIIGNSESHSDLHVSTNIYSCSSTSDLALGRSPPIESSPSKAEPILGSESHSDTHISTNIHSQLLPDTSTLDRPQLGDDTPSKVDPILDSTSHSDTYIDTHTPPHTHSTTISRDREFGSSDRPPTDRGQPPASDTISILGGKSHSDTYIDTHTHPHTHPTTQPERPITNDHLRPSTPQTSLICPTSHRCPIDLASLPGQVYLSHPSAREVWTWMTTTSRSRVDVCPLACTITITSDSD